MAQFLTLEEFRKMHQADAVLGVTLRANGASFEVEIETRGDVFQLVKARRAKTAAEVRRFPDPRKVLLLLRELDILKARIDYADWRPEEQAAERRSRPDRAETLKAAHAALSQSREKDMPRKGKERNKK